MENGITVGPVFGQQRKFQPLFSSKNGSLHEGRIYKNRFTDARKRLTRTGKKITFYPGNSKRIQTRFAFSLPIDFVGEI